MTQEEKSLLFKDLSARLPYKVIVDYSHNAFHVRNGNYVKHGSKCILNCQLLDIFMSPRQNEEGEYIKPYLRSMSSMTEEERHELGEVIKSCKLSPYGEIKDSGEDNILRYTVKQAFLALDYLYSKHFDVNHLIDVDLALEAPEGMYKTK